MNDARIYDIATRYIRKAIGDRPERPYESIGKLHLSLIRLLALADGELVVVSGFFSSESWYAFTTRRVVSQFQGALSSFDPSHGVEDEFPNFKGHEDWDNYDKWEIPHNKKPGVVPRDVATITSQKSGAVVRFEYQTWEGFIAPMYASRYWQIKHPFLHKFRTPAERQKNSKGE